MPELYNIRLKTNQLILLRAYSGSSVIHTKTKASKHTLIIFLFLKNYLIKYKKHIRNNFTQKFILSYSQL